MLLCPTLEYLSKRAHLFKNISKGAVRLMCFCFICYGTGHILRCYRGLFRFLYRPANIYKKKKKRSAHGAQKKTLLNDPDYDINH